jgi:hypothetical protein
MSTARIEERARACFRLAAHPSTGEGERAAALQRGLALLDKYGLDPDRFDIPGRTPSWQGQADRGGNPDAWHMTGLSEADLHAILRAYAARQARAEAATFAGVFGICSGCGGVASVGATCRACQLKAEATHADFMREEAWRRTQEGFIA